jgi:hypothetical protein
MVAAHLPYSRGVVGEMQRRVHAIFWTHRSWRCEYHMYPDGVKRVTLFHGREMTIDHVARDLDEARDVASMWRDLVGPEDWPESDVTAERRLMDLDRRDAHRGGRRMDDPTE